MTSITIRLANDRVMFHIFSRIRENFIKTSLRKKRPRRDRTRRARRKHCLVVGKTDICDSVAKMSVAAFGRVSPESAGLVSCRVGEFLQLLIVSGALTHDGRPGMDECPPGKPSS